MSKKYGIKDAAIGRSDIFKMAPEHIHVREGWNVRDVDFDPFDIDDLSLARSIAENGVREPLTVVWDDGKAFVTNGHRRLSAARYAAKELGTEIKALPCQTEDRYSNEADHVLSMIVRNSGKPLSPLEQARVFKRLIDLGWSIAEIARRVGKTPQWVGELLNLQAAPTEITNMVKSGEVSASLAVQTIAREKSRAPAVLSTAVAKAKAEGKSRATAKHFESRPAKQKASSNLIKAAEAVMNAPAIKPYRLVSPFIELAEAIDDAKSGAA